LQKSGGKRRQKYRERKSGVTSREIKGWSQKGNSKEIKVDYKPSKTLTGGEFSASLYYDQRKGKKKGGVSCEGGGSRRKTPTRRGKREVPLGQRHIKIRRRNGITLEKTPSTHSQKPNQSTGTLLTTSKRPAEKEGIIANQRF